MINLENYLYMKVKDIMEYWDLRDYCISQLIM